LLWSAKVLIVMAVGDSKAEALRAALEGQNPAGRIGEGDAAVEWYADREAASLV
jgi:6-phosphogluconolactonase/glucosamine-6-phosphate isomerase/deaminase